MKGLLTVISGFSGVGKGTLVRELLSRYPDQYVLSISATSRAPRTGEQEGVHYFYKTREEFMELIRQDAFLEYANYNGNFYGTPRKFVEEQLAAYAKRTVEERRAIPGLQPKRADVILTGACILKVIMERLNASQLTISDRGLRHGLAFDLLNK